MLLLLRQPLQLFLLLAELRRGNGTIAIVVELRVMEVKKSGGHRWSSRSAAVRLLLLFEEMHFPPETASAYPSGKTTGSW